MSRAYHTSEAAAPCTEAMETVRPRRRVLAVVVGQGRTEVVTIDELEAGRWEREISSVRRTLGVT